MTRTAAIATLALSAAALGGCRDDFSDEAYGVLDLAPTYDGGTPSNPAAGLPAQIAPSGGYIDGTAAEYYHFGIIPAVREDGTGAPRAVTVRPMYFFFTADGAPLFSRPVREARGGTDWIRGGLGVLDPNPKDFCAGVPAGGAEACAARNAEERKRPYPIRQRDFLIDAHRGSADYQRPIVDVSPANRGGSEPYTGLWEVVEVVAPRGYRPDSIKHAATLRRAVASGEFKRRPTGKAIDCPMVDERTAVVRGATDRPTPRPRVEIWYRRKLAFCFLAHGWETLGNDKGEVYFAGSDVERVQTFDVARLGASGDRTPSGAESGTESSADKGPEAPPDESLLVVPVARAYVPAIMTPDPAGGLPSITRFVHDLVTVSRPRRFAADPPGYSPLRWLHDVPVPAGYVTGALRAASSLDLSSARPRRPAGSTTGHVVANIPLRGVATRCSYPQLPNRQCGREVPVPGDPDRKTVDAAGDPVCRQLGLECNRNTCMCDVPFVGYGERCGPGIARCNPDPDGLAESGTVCFPPTGGFCHLACSLAAPNARAAENQGRKPVDLVDTRCKELRGTQCLRVGQSGTCLKLCDGNIEDPAQCSARVATGGAGGETRDIGEGQTCQNFGAEVCAWPDTYRPDP